MVLGELFCGSPNRQSAECVTGTQSTNIEGSPNVTTGTPSQRARPSARRARGHRRSLSVFYEASVQSVASPTCSTQGTSTLSAHFLNLPEMLRTVLNAPGDMILPRSRLRLRNTVLGHGSFGEVVCGELLEHGEVSESHVDPMSMFAETIPLVRCSSSGPGDSVDNWVVSPKEAHRGAANPAVRGDQHDTVDNSTDEVCPSKRGSANTENGCSFSATAHATVAADVPNSYRLTPSGDEGGETGELGVTPPSAPTPWMSIRSCSYSLTTPLVSAPQPRQNHFGPDAIVVPQWDNSVVTKELPVATGTSKTVAVKRVDKGRLSKRQQFVVAFHSEVQLCCTLKHPFIVDVYGVTEDETEIYLIMEAVEGGTLHDYAKNTPIHELQVTAPGMIAEIVLALEYLGQRGVAHRDIKPCNILLTRDLSVRLVDFGSACKIDDPAANTFGGTVAYMAPEVVKTGKATSTSDLWSLGCVVFELFAGRTAIEGKAPVLVMNAIKGYQNGSINFPQCFPPLAQSLVLCLLQYEPGDRLGSAATGGFESLKKHEFFSTVDWAQYNR